MGLTTAERQQFHDLGYVVKEDIYSQADLQPLKDGLTAVIDQTCATLQEEGLLGPETFAAEPFETRLGALFKADGEVGERVTRTIMGHGGGGFKEQAILDFLRHPPLVSCIESLVGPDIIGSSVYRIRPKAPGYSRGAVPWHQDSGYFMPHCDQSLIVTCWIPLVDATIENGCLYVLPKSHRSGVYRHYTGGQGGYLEIAREDLPAPEPVACPMRAGSVLFMTNLTRTLPLRTTPISFAGASISATKTPRFRTTSTKTPQTSTRNASQSPWPAGLGRATLSSKTRKIPRAKSPTSPNSRKSAPATNRPPYATPAAAGLLLPSAKSNQ